MPICRGCDAEIKWIETPAGKNMPLDAKSKNFYALSNKGQWMLVKGYEPHWSSCPEAAMFPSKKRG